MNLEKNLKFLDVYSIAIGAMISSGIFILPGIAYSYTGPSVFLSYFFAGVLALIGVFSTIELATAMPKAGGDYYFISRTMGPMVGTLSGILSWFALSLKSAFAIFGISEILHSFLGWNILLTGIIVTIIFVLLNIFGLKEAAKLELILVFGLLIIMAIFIVVGVGKINLEFFNDFAPKGINSIAITSGFIFISFGGLLNISSVAEEIDNPKKNIPLAIISSVVTITIIYTLMIIVTVGVLKGDRLGGSLTPIADAGKIILGNTGYFIISVGALLAFITTALAGIMSASRYPLALSRDKLLPKNISSVNSKYKTPIISIIFTGVFIIVSLLFNIEILVKLASSVILISYLLTNVSVLILRESKINNYKPSFKSPMYPWLQIISISVFGFFIFDLGLAAVEISIVIFVLSISIYFFYGKKRWDQEYALLHLVERVIDKEITSHGLEAELIEIIKKRDEIVFDDFDKLVDRSKIIDLEGNLALDDFFKKASEELSSLMNLNKEKVLESLIKREKINTTAISDFVAIPHIVIEETEKFNLLIARVKGGVKFSEESQNIKAIFIFSGMKKNRGFHLKILSAIAFLVQEKNFEKKWIEAKNINYLKDMIHLSKRKRT